MSETQEEAARVIADRLALIDRSKPRALQEVWGRDLARTLAAAGVLKGDGVFPGAWATATVAEVAAAFPPGSRVRVVEGASGAYGGELTAGWGVVDWVRQDDYLPRVAVYVSGITYYPEALVLDPGRPEAAS